MSTIFTVKTCLGFDNTPLRYGLIQPESHEESSEQHPIVFIPGLGGSVKFALDFLKRFVPHHGPIYSLDARGIGLNEQVAPLPHPNSYLRDFHSFIQHLQQENRISNQSNPVMIGLSLGGIYAIMYSTEYSHPFQGIILIAPAFRPHPKLFTPAFKCKSYASILLKGAHACVTMPYRVQDLTRNPDKYNDPNFKEPLTLPAFYLFLVERLCRKAFARISRIDSPISVVIPENDRVCDPEAMKQAYNRIPHQHKALFTYPALYHDIMLEPEEDQDRVFSDLDAWINSLPFHIPPIRISSS